MRSLKSCLKILEVLRGFAVGDIQADVTRFFDRGSGFCSICLIKTGINVSNERASRNVLVSIFYYDVVITCKLW